MDTIDTGSTLAEQLAQVVTEQYGYTPEGVRRLVAERDALAAEVAVLRARLAEAEEAGQVASDLPVDAEGVVEAEEALEVVEVDQEALASASVEVARYWTPVDQVEGDEGGAEVDQEALASARADVVRYRLEVDRAEREGAEGRAAFYRERLERALEREEDAAEPGRWVYVVMTQSPDRGVGEYTLHSDQREAGRSYDRAEERLGEGLVRVVRCAADLVDEVVSAG